ncbi:hypothetical protein A483_HHAL011642 [Halyomorpha halys]|nr:hypothetical protein A483_HHAL011642 [Halyomorpha halys]
MKLIRHLRFQIQEN